MLVDYCERWAIADGLGIILRDDSKDNSFGSSLRMVRRHAVTILIFIEGMASPLWYFQRYNLDGNLEDIAATMGFTYTRCHQRIWRCFTKRASNPGFPVWSWVIIRLAHREGMQGFNTGFNLNPMPHCNCFHIGTIIFYMLYFRQHV